MQYLILPLPQTRKPAANRLLGLIGGLFRRRLYQVVPLRLDDLSPQMRKDLGLDCRGKSQPEMLPNPAPMDGSAR